MRVCEMKNNSNENKESECVQSSIIFNSKQTKGQKHIAAQRQGLR